MSCNVISSFYFTNFVPIQRNKKLKFISLFLSSQHIPSSRRWRFGSWFNFQSQGIMSVSNEQVFVKILNISNICTISIIFHDFVSATQRDEIEINSEMGALIFLRCGKNWFRRGRRGGRSLQPAISNAFAIEKRSKDAIGPRKLAGGVHNWMKPMLNITRETHKYAEIIEEGPNVFMTFLIFETRGMAKKGISSPSVAVSPHYVPAKELHFSFFFPFHARPWKSTIELNVSFVWKSKKKEKILIYLKRP